MMSAKLNVKITPNALPMAYNLKILALQDAGIILPIKPQSIQVLVLIKVPNALLKHKQLLLKLLLLSQFHRMIM